MAIFFLFSLSSVSTSFKVIDSLWIDLKSLLVFSTSSIYLISFSLSSYDKIRLSFNSNNNYICQIEEIYDKLGSITNFFGFTSFKKREWILILNDIIQIYSKIDFIW